MYKDKKHTANAPYVNVSTSDDKAVLDPFMNLDILEEQPKNESVKKVKRKTRKKRRSEIPQLKFSKDDKDTRLFVYWDTEKRWYAGSVMTYSRGKRTIVFDDGDVKTFDLLRVRTHFGKTPPAVHEENSMSSDLKITEEEKDDISDELFQKFKVYYAKHNPDLSARNIKSLLKKHRTRAQLSVLVQKIHKKYDDDAQKILVAYTDDNDSNKGYYRLGTVSGTSISFGSETEFHGYEVSTGYVTVGAVFDSTNNVVVLAYRGRDASNNLDGYSRVIQNAATVSSSNLTATNFIGVSDAAYADGATATVQIAGSVDDAQSSLTAGQLYYVQTDGTLSTTAASPSVIAGTAISATKLIVKG